MDIRNNTTLGTIDNTPVVQLAGIYNKISDVFVELGIEEKNTRIEYPEEGLNENNYCPLPEYCLIEDKWKYLAGILK